MIAILEQFDLEDIDNATKDVIQALCELGLAPELAYLCCCRVISACSAEQIDSACQIIDEFSELPFEGLRIEEL